MNSKTAKALVQYISLDKSEQDDFDAFVERLKNAPLTKRIGGTGDDYTSLVKQAERVATGPLASNVCPACGR